ncbi:MAG: ethylbenzene dehydrogenase-related protein, partial [Pirellulaceae bacterium]|nr:ethylbenzene dehydrogenase-related protein [Pirellulaceae bacterium]
MLDAINGWAVKCGVIVLLLTMAAVSSGVPEPPTGVPELVLEARVSDETPKLDGMLDDPVWCHAKPIYVAVHQPATKDRTGDTMVQLRAMRTTLDIFIAARWSDPSESIHKEVWTYDNTHWRRNPDVDEDRLALIFPIGNSVPWFSESGCALTCHVRRSDSLTLESVPKWYKGTLA